uniref:Reverse transcriptase domain-containing protein n=1 Tax=Cannabis sativa TaxID=3483 RepID=A0A803NKP6_CANSA
MHPLKSPGPDGFSGIFFRKYWPTVGGQVCKMVQEFFSSGILPPALNHTFICLIPKSDNANTFDRFRPISLCNFGYKIISRILTDRLKKILDRLISPHQSAFIPGRWIAECSVLAQEVLHAMKNKKGKRGVMAIKTDLSKAYDRLEWKFIHKVLQANRFSNKVISLNMSCVSSVSFTILLNGAPLAPFNPNQGLRQGDPLSPFLFILCSEVLTKMLSKAEKDNNLCGIKISRNATPISHLFYADDAIYFCQATEKNASSIMSILKQYEEWSGQKINKEKSGVVFSPNTKNLLMEIIGMPKLNAKEKYLGNPFFFTANRRNDFQFLRQKVLNRIEGWKAKCLWQAGRTTLVSAVLQSIPTYFMATSLVPQTLCEELDKLLAKFWWIGPRSDKQRYCGLKGWGSLCQPKCCGGLGFKRFKDMNTALLAKLIWEILQKKDKLWIKALRAKYCSNLDAWSVEKHDLDSRLWENLLQTRELCVAGAGFVVANGEIDLWTKPWIPWKSIQQLKDGFHCNRIHAFNKKPTKSGNFSVKSAYWLYQEKRFSAPTPIWKKQWKQKMHPRLSLFMWKILADCLPTLGKLSFLNLADRSCVLCGELEDAYHLVAKCSLTRGLWFKSAWGLRLDSFQWRNVMDFGLWWTELGDMDLKIFVVCIYEVLWYWRNSIRNNNKQWTLEEIFKDCTKRAFEFSSNPTDLEGTINEDIITTPSTDTKGYHVFQVDALVAVGSVGIAAVYKGELIGSEDYLVVDHLRVENVL